jgi:hypothetical protein
VKRGGGRRKFTSLKVLELCRLILVVKAGSKVELSEVKSIRRWEVYSLVGICRTGNNLSIWVEL